LSLDYFAPLIIIAGNSFDSHANQLPAGLFVASQLFSKTKTPSGALVKKIYCDPSGTELEPVGQGDGKVE
jgi:hypothetical protein